VQYEVVIGLEIHAQLKTETKIFCGCKTSFGDVANSHGCPVCLGLPGALPVMNRQAVEMAVLAGLATDCEIRDKSIFARKNYFYPDLPKGYQISQYDQPICEGGHLDIEVDGVTKRLGVTRIHLEEDAGKLVHDQDIDSLFDVNRCGTPLIEIVSEPDMRSPQEAYAYLTKMKKIIQYIDVSDCNMEEGSFRCDANISLRPFGQEKLGTKRELKNMNSFSNVVKALEYEIEVQREILDSGGKIIQETLLWDPNKNATSSMRTKEDAHDYRYFPDPDLVPLMVPDSMIDRIRASMPELPVAKESRFAKEYNLDSEAVMILTDSINLANYFETVVKECGDSKMAASWVMGDVLRILKEKQCNITDLKISSTRLADLLKLIKADKISASAGKKVFNAIEEQDKEPSVLVDELGLAQVSDTGALEAVMVKIFADNPSEVERFKGGDKKLTAFFVGQAMKATQGKANPKEINTIIGKLLG